MSWREEWVRQERLWSTTTRRTHWTGVSNEEKRCGGRTGWEQMSRHGISQRVMSGVEDALFAVAPWLGGDVSDCGSADTLFNKLLRHLVLSRCTLSARLCRQCDPRILLISTRVLHCEVACSHGATRRVFSFMHGV